jgi:uracil-DNA glycosylase
MSRGRSSGCHRVRASSSPVRRPGARAHASGVPFDDPSGVRLRAWLRVDTQLFYDADRIAILPMGFCFPGHDRQGGDLPPRPECRERWHDAIMPNLSSLQLIVMVGRYAQAYHLRRAGLARQARTSLGDTVRAWRSLAAGPPPRLFPLPHPSWRNTGWLKKNPWFAAELLPELQSAVRQCLD